LEGIINSKIRNKNSKLESGFSLVEMVVVMAIIAILTTISATAFYSSRKQAVVNSTAQDILSTIREAQNKSVSVMSSKNGDDAKIWAFSSDPNNGEYSLVYYAPTRDEDVKTGLGAAPERTEVLPAGVSVTASRYSNNPTVAFTSPFGSAYLIDGFHDGMDVCSFTTESTRPAKDYYISTGSTAGCDFASTENNRNYEVVLTVHLDGAADALIRIKTSGDAYIE